MVKLITFHSETHRNLYENYFLKSFNKYLKNEFVLLDKKITQISKTGVYYEDGFRETMKEKIKHIVDSMDENSNQMCVFSDCDVEFFGEMKEDLTNQLDGFDIKLQNDVTNLCAGFFTFIQNKKTKKLFENILQAFEDYTFNGVLKKGIDDQVLLNRLISKVEGLRYGTLDKKYFNVAQSLGPKRWNGENFRIPEDIIMFHSNWTVGLENKVKLLDKTREMRKC